MSRAGPQEGVMRLLAVEDEPVLSKLLKDNLTREGFAVDVAAGIEDAQAHLDTVEYDLVLLDLGLPDGDGLHLLPAIRAKAQLPVIAITARDSIDDRIRGLNAGADDYLVKPFALDELVARIHAVLRRPAAVLDVTVRFGDLELNLATKEVEVNGHPLALRRLECAALELLMRAKGRVVMRSRLIDNLYAFGDEPGSNAVDVQIARLRKQLRDGRSGVTIRAVRGVGYLATWQSE
jgi:DNA-binding response OmpR family regulator